MAELLGACRRDCFNLHPLVRLEKLLILIERIPIGHPGYVIADDAVHIAFGLKPLVRRRRKLLGLVAIDIEEARDEARGLVRHSHDAVMVVEIIGEELSHGASCDLHCF